MTTLNIPTDFVSEPWAKETSDLAFKHGFEPIPMYLASDGKWLPTAKFTEPTDYRDSMDWYSPMECISLVLRDLILVDLDGNKEGAPSIEELIESAAQVLEMSIDEFSKGLFQFNAQGNSLHYLFQLPSGLDVSSLNQSNDGLLVPFIDFKRGNAPLHVKQGKHVLWRDRKDIPTLNAVMIQKVFKEKSKVMESKIENSVVPQGEGTTAYGSKVITSCVNKIELAVEGRRNDTLNTQAYKVYGYVKGNQIDQEEADVRLKAAGLSVGLSEREVMATLKSAWEGAESTGDYDVKTQDLYNNVQRRIMKVLDTSVAPIGIVTIKQLDKAMHGIGWRKKENAYYMLTQYDEFAEFARKDGVLGLVRSFPDLINWQALEPMLCELEDKERTETIKNVTAAIYHEILDSVRYANHVVTVTHRVDMFLKETTVTAGYDGDYVVTRAHMPFKTGYIDPVIIDDYKQHFPQLDTFLDLLVASRFAPDRKHCYLWMRAIADFGKGFFTNVLKRLGIVVELNEKEVEAAIEGRPVGKQATNFFRAWVTLFNEFKTVKSELKQLESTLEISPKNQLVQTVELYLKLFLSADDVKSLTGVDGVEGQFASRFNYWDNTQCGAINTRKKYCEVGSEAYFESVVHYIGLELNRRVEHMRSLGRHAAMKEAEVFIKAFHDEYSIANTFGELSTQQDEILSDFKDWCLSLKEDDEGGQVTGKHRVEAYSYLYRPTDKEKYGELLIRAPTKVFALWIKDTFDVAVQGTYMKRSNDYLDVLWGSRKRDGKVPVIGTTKRQKGILI